MSIRTDLAIECKEQINGEINGVTCEKISFEPVEITRLDITNDSASAKLNKPIGTYITIDVPPFSDDAPTDDRLITAIKTELMRLLPKSGTVLVIGLGNTAITPDAFGPNTAKRVLATRHIAGELSRSAGLGDLRAVAVVAPGVLGQTGIETVEILSGIVDRIKPSCVIAVDALASRRLSRLGRTVQMSNTGIAPGSGVGNHRLRINEETLGVPVISIGVPTVVDAITLAADLTGTECTDTVEPRGAKMIVTPQEIDLIIDRASHAVAHSINCALQTHLSHEVLLELV